MTAAMTARRGKTAGKATRNAEFRALASSLRGSMPYLNITVDKYLSEKHAETDAENAARENRA